MSKVITETFRLHTEYATILVTASNEQHPTISIKPKLDTELFENVLIDTELIDFGEWLIKIGKQIVMDKDFLPVDNGQ